MAVGIAEYELGVPRLTSVNPSEPKRLGGDDKSREPEICGREYLRGFHRLSSFYWQKT